MTWAAARVAGSATALVSLTAIAWWALRVRAALDLACACECAASTVTVRVIGASRRAMD